MSKTRLFLFLAAFCLPASAEAAVDWCRLAAEVPSYDHPFEASERGIDQLGCTKAGVTSAHSRKWTCTDEAPGDVTVQLLRLTEGKGSGSTVFAVSGDMLISLDPFRGCSFVAGTGTFDPNSIAVRDRVHVKARGYLPTHLTLFSISQDFGIAVATSSNNSRALEHVEEVLYGFTRPFLPTTSVEIAGRNLVSSSAVDMLSSLVSRGAKILTDDRDYLVRSLTLSPPIGLEGVTEISTRSVGQLTGMVEYKISGEDNYRTYVALLDDKYGESEAESSTSKDKKGCRLRMWESGKAQIFGEYCPSGEATLSFFNLVAGDQTQKMNAYLERDTSGDTKDIDRDNL